MTPSSLSAVRILPTYKGWTVDLSNHTLYNPEHGVRMVVIHDKDASCFSYEIKTYEGYPVISQDREEAQRQVQFHRRLLKEAGEAYKEALQATLH